MSFVWFLVGIAFGVVGFVWFANRILLKREGVKSVDELEKKAEALKSKYSAVRQRMERIKEITEEQLDLVGQIDAPSKNALHSRHKNGLGTRVKALEDEKLSLLKAILEDGFDPVITTSNTRGETEQLKLSDYLAGQGIDVASSAQEESAPESTATASEAPRRVGKFVVYKGGKDDTTH